MKNKALKNLSSLLVDNKELWIDMGKILGKGACAIGLLYISSKLDIPLSISPDGNLSTRSHKINLSSSNDVMVNVPNIIFNKNSQDSAISTFTELGKAASFDSVKEDYVRKIYKIAQDCTDDNTKMLAIAGINAIAKTMCFGSNQNSASNYILKIAN